MREGKIIILFETEDGLTTELKGLGDDKMLVELAKVLFASVGLGKQAP